MADSLVLPTPAEMKAKLDAIIGEKQHWPTVPKTIKLLEGDGQFDAHYLRCQSAGLMQARPVPAL